MTVVQSFPHSHSGRAAAAENVIEFDGAELQLLAARLNRSGLDRDIAAVVLSAVDFEVPAILSMDSPEQLDQVVPEQTREEVRFVYHGRYTLELNRFHPLIHKMVSVQDDELLLEYLWILYEQSRLAAGLPVKNMSRYCEHVQLLMLEGLWG